jgi:hypothetical protein
MSKKPTNVPEGPTLFSEVLFNVERHDLITEAAYELLTPEAKAAVDALLAPLHLFFQNSGGWADRIKDRNPPKDAETKKFLQNSSNQSHRTWHYVDLPLKSKSYAQAEQLGFTRDDDVVQTIRKCVLVLKKKSNRFSRVNALRLLGHLVGDVHQPLHVGCGFVNRKANPPELVFDPQVIKDNNFKDDTGGNDILLPGAGNLHSFWDGSLSGKVNTNDLLAVSASSKRKALVKSLVSGARKLAGDSADKAGAVGLASNDGPEDWAVGWANDSLKVSVKAYKNIVITGKQGNDFKVDWEGRDAYIKRCRPLVLKQMKLAVRHLADLLNEVFQ